MNYVQKICLQLFLCFSSMQAGQYGKKFGAMLGTAAYVGLSCAPLCVEGYFNLNNTIYEQEMEKLPLSELHPLVNRFAQQELRSLGLSHVRVMPFDSTFACNRHIAVDQAQMDDTEIALRRIKKRLQEGLEVDIYDVTICKEFKGVLHHEANHILHKDALRLFVLASTVSLLPIGARVAVQALRTVSKVKKISNIRKVFQGVVNGCVSLEILFTGHRLIEQQADDAVQGISALEGLELATVLTVEDLKDRRKTLPTWQLFMYEHMLTHPSPTTRLEKIRQRIVEEQNKQDQK